MWEIEFSEGKPLHFSPHRLLETGDCNAHLAGQPFRIGVALPVELRMVVGSRVEFLTNRIGVSVLPPAKREAGAQNRAR